MDITTVKILFDMISIDNHNPPDIRREYNITTDYIKSLI
jgi:hypothetical protein